MRNQEVAFSYFGACFPLVLTFSIFSKNRVTSMDFLRRINLLNRKKKDPGTFIFTGDATNGVTLLQRFRYGLCLTLMDDCDAIISFLDSSINLFFSVQGHRMNQVMKTLTIVATIFIPLTFIAGIYGMNVAYMPELEWRYGYLAVWILIVLVLVGMVIYFRQKKWF